MRFVDASGNPTERVSRQDQLRFSVEVTVRDTVKKPLISIGVMHGDQQAVFSEFCRLPRELSPGQHRISGHFSASALKPESYFFNVFLFDGEAQLDRVDGHSLPEIVDPTGDPLIEGRRWGIVRVPVVWDEI